VVLEFYKNQNTTWGNGTANEPISAGEIAPSSGNAEYKIIVDGPRRYGVEVTSPDRFLSVRGFATELDAAMWIAEQKAGEAAAAQAKGPPPAREA
jgi:hypothetical protein